LLRRSEIEKVLVIREHYNLLLSGKEMSPSFESSDDGKEFPIIDLIVSFGGVKGLGEIPAGVVCPIFISLEEYCSSSHE